MKLLIQKVNGLKIDQEDKTILDLGDEICYLFYVGIEKGDEKKDLNRIVKNIENLQIIDENGRFLKSLRELKPKLIFISQITLISDFKNGRINFNKSLDFNLAKNIFENLVISFQKLNYNVFRGDFGSYLKIKSINLGPVNFLVNA